MSSLEGSGGYDKSGVSDASTSTSTYPHTPTAPALAPSPPSTDWPSLARGHRHRACRLSRVAC
jgi:hypothetical protein